MDLPELLKKTEEQEAKNHELFSQLSALRKERDGFWEETRKLEDSKESEEEKSHKKLRSAQFRYERAVQQEKDYLEEKDGLFDSIQYAQEMLARKKKEASCVDTSDEKETDSQCTHNRKRQHVKTENPV